MTNQEAMRGQHDKDFPPQQSGEPDRDFLLRALREHRASHQEWVEHYDTGCQCGDDHPATVVGREYQQVAVERYDKLIAIALQEVASRDARIEKLEAALGEATKHLTAIQRVFPAFGPAAAKAKDTLEIIISQSLEALKEQP